MAETGGFVPKVEKLDPSDRITSEGEQAFQTAAGTEAKPATVISEQAIKSELVMDPKLEEYRMAAEYHLANIDTFRKTVSDAKESTRKGGGKVRHEGGSSTKIYESVARAEPLDKFVRQIERNPVTQEAFLNAALAETVATGVEPFLNTLRRQLEDKGADAITAEREMRKFETVLFPTLFPADAEDRAETRATLKALGKQHRDGTADTQPVDDLLGQGESTKGTVGVLRAIIEESEQVLHQVKGFKIEGPGLLHKLTGSPGNIEAHLIKLKDNEQPSQAAQVRLDGLKLTGALVAEVHGSLNVKAAQENYKRASSQATGPAQ